MSYSVIIPSNVAQKLRKCVQHLLQHTTSLAPHKIIVVDDGASKDWVNGDPPVSWAAGQKPFVYARNVNLGVQAAPTEDDLVILGDDVRMLTSLDLLAETGRRGEVGAVSPAIVGVVGNVDQERRTTSVVRATSNPLCFVCVFIPRRVWETVGGLDESFVYYGGEDVDWNWRAQAMGYRLLVDDRCVAIHNDPTLPSAFRTKPDIDELFKKGVEQLRKKWPEKKLP